MNCLKPLLPFLLALLLSLPVGADEPISGFRSSGLPIPRFVSLKSDKIYVRTGPATRYPIKWVYKKESLPVEIIQEFDTWRKIRDFEGEEGWIHQSLLSGARTVLVKADDLVPMREDHQDGARLVAKLEPLVIASLDQCVPNWCEISTGGYRGWVKRNFLYGIYEGENFN